MKSLKHALNFILASLLVITLISCGKNNSSKNDASSSIEASSSQETQASSSSENSSSSEEIKENYVQLNSSVEYNEGVTTIKISTDEAAFSTDITIEDVILYDVSLADTQNYSDVYSFINDNKKIISQLLIDISNLVFVDNKTITVDAITDFDTDYGFFINPTKMLSEQFGYGFLPSPLERQIDVQTQFEDDIIKGMAGWDVAKMAIDIASAYASIIIGAYTGQALAISGGIFSIISTMGGKFFDNSPSISDVMNRLDNIEQKIDQIADTINQNQQELLDVLARQEAMIDELLLNQYTQNITNYNNDKINPIETFNISYKDKVEQALKSYLEEGKTISVYYNSNNELVFTSGLSETEMASFTKVEYTIDNFESALANLEKHNNIVTDELPTEMKKDIKKYLPTGTQNLDSVTNNVYLTIMDNISYTVLSADTMHDSIVQLMANTKFLCQAISGANGDSILNSYSGRLKHIYNFAIEYKPVARSLLASIRFTLDQYYNLAQTCCLAQKINCKDMADAYTAAANYIKSYYDNAFDMPDNYSFAANRVVKGDLIGAYYNTWYTNPGNDPSFHAQLIFKNNIRITHTGACTTDGDTVNIGSFNIIDQNLYKAIGRRYIIQRSMGLTEHTSFSDYMGNIGTFDAKYKDYKYLAMANIVPQNANFVVDMSDRDLNSGDTGLLLYCQAKGNPDGYYYRVGMQYNYRCHDTADCWSGHLTYASLITGDTGTNYLTNQNLIAYARYDESHWYWIDDEYYSFVTHDVGTFFYILYY
ncbi:MAG: hypothetical protein K6E20_04510 [Acholeplasmatales bacterium]|nr:hypothetical protein [Acholeplasmatales bacterium]